MKCIPFALVYQKKKKKDYVKIKYIYVYNRHFKVVAHVYFVADNRKKYTRL